MTTSFYRTPEASIEAMIASIQANGSKLTDFHVGSTTRNFFEALAVGSSQNSLIVEQLRQDSHLATATGDALDDKGADYLVPRIAAVAATGSIEIARPAAGAAVTIPAGWSQLLTVPTPGQQPVAFITLEAAVFAPGDLAKTVLAQALTPGTVGNIADNTQLLPAAPVAGFSTASGFSAFGAFSNGVDAETDDAYRNRIPIDVQGRVNGTALAFQAAALRVPGASSANVLRAGDTRANGTTVPGGQAEVYYEGSAGLLTAVQSAVSARATLNQQVTAFNAALLRLIANCIVYAKVGTDPVALASSVATAMAAAVSLHDVGEKVYLSTIVQAVDAVPLVLGVTVPFSDFRKSTDGAGTSGNVVTPANLYPDLQLADCSVAVTLVA